MHCSDVEYEWLVNSSIIFLMKLGSTRVHDATDRRLGRYASTPRLLFTCQRTRFRSRRCLCGKLAVSQSLLLQAEHGHDDLGMLRAVRRTAKIRCRWQRLVLWSRNRNVGKRTSILVCGLSVRRLSTVDAE